VSDFRWVSPLAGLPRKIINTMLTSSYQGKWYAIVRSRTNLSSYLCPPQGSSTRSWESA
jgi:hypothetical protein